jgi:hypothetical protein
LCTKGLLGPDLRENTPFPNVSLFAIKMITSATKRLNAECFYEEIHTYFIKESRHLSGTIPPAQIDFSHP